MWDTSLLHTSLVSYSLESGPWWYLLITYVVTVGNCQPAARLFLFLWCQLCWQKKLRSNKPHLWAQGYTWIFVTLCQWIFFWLTDSSIPVATISILIVVSKNFRRIFHSISCNGFELVGRRWAVKCYSLQPKPHVERRYIRRSHEFSVVVNYLSFQTANSILRYRMYSILIFLVWRYYK